MADRPLDNWRSDFARSANWRRERDLHFQRDRERRRSKEERADRIEGELSDLAAIATIATEAQLAEFRATLDEYDEATVEALMLNEEQLRDVRAKLEDMLGKAYVLEDGRRVFKSEDGVRVFDEHGARLTPDEVDPNAIEDWRPTWESFETLSDSENALLQERQRILDFQEKVDHARATADKEGLTTDELNDLEDSLEADMPLAVRRQIDGYEAPPSVEARSSFTQAAGNPLSPDLADLNPDFIPS